MFCANCGNEIQKENAKFCPCCGNKMPNKEPAAVNYAETPAYALEAAAPAAKKPLSPGVVFGVTIGVGVLIIILIAFLLIRPYCAAAIKESESSDHSYVVGYNDDSVIADSWDDDDVLDVYDDSYDNSYIYDDDDNEYTYFDYDDHDPSDDYADYDGDGDYDWEDAMNEEWSEMLEENGISEEEFEDYLENFDWDDVDWDDYY